MKISFIVTIFNEEKTIVALLKSLLNQTKLPDEIIIVDGGSKDKTQSKISAFIEQSSSRKKKPEIKFYIKKGNRSVGRNEAIKRASGTIIVCTDAGNELDKHWIEWITKPFQKQSVDVVAGYYKGKPKNIFQKCLIPFALVMPDKLKPGNFLPATRSIAFTKAIWKKAGGFDKKLSHNEDYVFARKLEAIGARRVFVKEAIVHWFPRSTYKESFIMFYRFALGDAEAGITRTNVLVLFARYLLGVYILFLVIFYQSLLGLLLLIVLAVLYIIWSIKKNYRYVKDKKAFFILPKLQLTADVAVFSGTLYGLMKLYKGVSFFSLYKQHAFLFFIVIIYTLLMCLTLTWGIPNQNHPFPYHMDEWHQLQAVRATVKYGTPNIQGAANGTMFHFFLSAVYLAPFTIVNYIDPSVLKVNDLEMREKIFVLLRINTILYGIGSLIILYALSRLLRISAKIVLPLFIFTPVWLYISGYFKYDIALTFWLLLSLLFLFRFYKSPNGKNYILSAIPIGLSFAVKVSAVPLFPIYLFSFFWFYPNWRHNLNYLFLGFFTAIGCALLFGMPDTIFGKGNILLFFYENVISGPVTSQNFAIEMSAFAYFWLYQYPTIFGHGLFLLFIAASIVFGFLFIQNGLRKTLSQYRFELFLFISLCLFVISLLPLQMYGGGNRSIVLLPFIVLICGLAIKKIASINRFKKIFIGLLIIVSTIQGYESLAWVYMKLIPSPNEVSSEWIINNIPSNQTIGLENIPIYQNVPDIIQKEFYFQQYNVSYKTRYSYKIIDNKSATLPSYIVMTNEEIDSKVYKTSPKKDLLHRLKQEGYTKLVSFKPDFRFFRYVGTETDYYLSYIQVAPVTISVYKK